MVDIRIPIGLMFSILGVLISVFGFVTMSDSCNVSAFTWHQCKYYYGSGDAYFWSDYALSVAEEEKSVELRAQA